LLPAAAQTTPTTELPVRRDSAAWISPTRPQQASHLTLDEAIYAAQTQSIAAMVAKYTFLSSYWSYRSYRASRLPSLNLTGEVLSFDRSLRLLQDYDTGEMRYMENYNLQNTLGLSIKQNIALTGGTLRLYSSLNRLDQFAPKDSKSYYSQPITLSYTQPLFAYNQFKWDKKIAPKEYELAKRTYIRSDGGHHDTGGDLLFQPAAQQDQAHDRRQELQQHQIPLRHRRTTARTGQRHQGRAAATPTADAQRQPVDQ